MTALLLLCSLILSFLITGLIRQQARRWQLIDIPNQRSSHELPTPRGGGLGFIFSFLFMSLVSLLVNQQPSYALLLLTGLAALVALIGFWDDKYGLPAKVRLILHLFLATLFILSAGGMPALPIWGMVFPAGMLLNGLGMLSLVWLLNLYNFMDGIDGLASLEAITTCAAMAFIYQVQGEVVLFFPPLLLLAAVGGFLLWNFPKARIFMGDAGSGFLGFFIGGLAVLGAQSNPKFWWCWLILLGVFIVDASLTLLRRALRGEAVMQAHRSHAYQYAARQFQSHPRVSLGISLINLLWLFPLAWLVANDNLSGPTGLMLGYLPLICLALRFKAGTC